jgi:hypothetical protein
MTVVIIGALTVLLAVAPSVEAGCAWIVWTRVGPSEWQRFEMFDNLPECVQVIDKSERAHRATSAQSVSRLSKTELRSWATDRAYATADVHLMCLPDTIAPPAKGALR